MKISDKENSLNGSDLLKTWKNGISVNTKVNGIKDLVKFWLNDLLSAEQEEYEEKLVKAELFISGLNIQKIPKVSSKNTWSIIRTSWIIDRWFPEPLEWRYSKSQVRCILNNAMDMPNIQWKWWSIVSTDNTVDFAA